MQLPAQKEQVDDQMILIGGFLMFTCILQHIFSLILTIAFIGGVGENIVIMWNGRWGHSTWVGVLKLEHLGWYWQSKLHKWFKPYCKKSTTFQQLGPCHCFKLTIVKYPYQKWQRGFGVDKNTINMTGVTSGARTAYLSGAPEFTSGF